MPIIAHRKDPAGIAKPEIYQVESGENFIDWLISYYGDASKLCGNLACSVILNGKEIFRSDHEECDESILDFEIGEFDHVYIVNRPAGVLAIVTAIVAVIAVAVSVYAYLNMPKLPGDAEGRSESPNNRLNAASNQFRPYKAIPECFGFGVSYPDFIQPSYYYYEGNIKRQIGLFCVTAGQASITQTRVGETNINSIPESSATVYYPALGQIPPQSVMSIHQAAATVDGQVLLAPNDPSIGFDFQNAPIAQNGVYVELSLDSAKVADASISAGDTVRISYFGIETVSYVNGGVVAFVGSVPETDHDNTPEPITTFTGSIERRNPDGSPVNYIGWFDLEGDQVSECWFHWRMPIGIRSKDGGAITMQVEFQIEQLDGNGSPTGAVWTKTDTLRDNTLDPQFRTLQFTPSNTPGMPVGKFRARCRRLTGIIDIGQNASEKVEIEAFVSVTPYAQPNFGDVTLLLVQRKATLLSGDQAGTKINCDYRRKLPYYNRATGDYQQWNLVDTNSFADAIAYTLISRGGETAQTVALDELYAIYDDLSHPQLGGFTFTFDDASVSGGERVEAMANVARVVPFHDGYSWRFNRDEAKPIIGAMFNRRSLIGSGGTQRWLPQRADDSDSVKVTYVDPVTNTESFVERRFNINSGTFEAGSGQVVKEIKLAGCRNQFQAINRAELEIRRIAYQRRVVTDTASRDALSVDLLDRVAWVDINDVDTFDGEIVGINGDTFDTTERFEPEDGVGYVVFVTDVDGYPSNTVTCNPRPDTEFGFIASGLSGAFVASGNQQLGSRYFIAQAGDVTASMFTLKSRAPLEDGNVQIELTEYDPRMFEKDGLAPPQGSPILNDGLRAQAIEQSAVATSTLTFNDDGTISLNGSSAFWFDGGATPGIGAQFEVRVTLQSGATPSGVLGVWSAISGDTFTLASGTTSQSCSLKVEIRQISQPENYATNVIQMEAVNASPVALPASVAIENTITAGYGAAYVEFLSNGSWDSSDTHNGSYTTSGYNVGRLYEARATHVSGDPVDNVDAWLSCADGGVRFGIESGVASSAVIDVELREIAEPLNTATMQVTLTIVE